MVEAQHAHIAERIDGRDRDILVGREYRQDVGRRLLVPIRFARIERRRRGRGIGYVEPFDPVDLGDLAAGGEARRLLARHIIGVLDEDRLAAGDPFLLDEFERARADRFRDLLEGVGLGDPLGHHERHIARQFAERAEEERKRRLQRDRKALVAIGGHRADRLHHFLPELVALCPALDRGDAIGGAHGLAVMPFQAVAQREFIGELVVADGPFIDHLRLRLEILVEREQRVEDEIAEIAGDVGGRPDRVDAAEIGLGDEAECLCRRLCPASPRGREQRNPDQRARQTQLCGNTGHRSPCSSCSL